MLQNCIIICNVFDILLLLLQNHPDKHLNDPSMHNKFIRIKEAYSVLINPITRRSYDMVLQNEKKLKAPSNSTKTYTRTYTYTSPRSSGLVVYLSRIGFQAKILKMIQITF